MSITALHADDREPQPEDATTQLSFEGFPVKQSRYTLKSVSSLLTAKRMTYNQHVRFSGYGRVAGIGFRESGGDLVRVHEIEVLEAALED